MDEQVTLARTISFPLLVLYGLGTILGAGIYVLVGKVSGISAMMAPLSFVVAAVIAWVTALSYSQLVVLFPHSAGEAVYVENAFGKKQLTILVGVLIVFTGVVSAATLANAFSGYFKVLIDMPEVLVMILVVVALTAIASWGITESLLISGLVTLIEIAGLLLILFYSADSLLEFPARAEEILLPGSLAEIVGVVSGAFLAFYAFIGFEDMVNVVEEVKEPKRVMPKAILWVIVISTLLYFLIALVAVLSLPLDILSASDAPLILLIEERGAFGVRLIAVIGMVAIVNGVLIQIIMAARVIYGMTLRYGGLSILAYVHPKTRTPLIATVVVSVLVLLFALALPLETLAKTTSFIILLVFTSVNLALLKVRNKKGHKDLIHQRQFPLLGAVLCMSLIVFQLFSLYLS